MGNPHFFHKASRENIGAVLQNYCCHFSIYSISTIIDYLLDDYRPSSSHRLCLKKYFDLNFRFVCYHIREFTATGYYCNVRETDRKKNKTKKKKPGKFETFVRFHRFLLNTIEHLVRFVCVTFSVFLLVIQYVLFSVKFVMRRGR